MANVSWEGAAKVLSGFALGLLSSLAVTGSIQMVFEKGGLEEAAAVVIAIAALGVAWSQAHATRLHNRLSAKPVIEFVVRCSSVVGLGVDLRNDGLGPAFLDSLKVTLNGKTLELVEGRDLLEFSRSLYAVPPTSGTLGSFSVGAAIRVGQTLHLVDYVNDANLLKNAGHANSTLTGLVVDMEYRCIYGDKHKTRQVVS